MSLCSRLFIVGLFISAFAAPCVAQDGSNVLLIRNDTSPDSQQIASRYAAVRHIPPENVLPLTVTPSEEIDRSDYAAQIEQPIGTWLIRNAAQDRILYIVLTKGIPLRIRGTGGQDGTVASVDSELALLYRKLLGVPVPVAGPVPNPYFQGDRALNTAKRFSHGDMDIFLVSRLDGFTLADVFALIEKGSAPESEGEFLLDQRATLLGDRTGDGWLAAAAKDLTAMGLGNRVVLDTTSNVLNSRKQVLGYYSWGSNDPAIKRRKFDFGFVPGALAAMFVSSDGRTFKEPPQTWAIGNWPDTKTHYEGSPQSLAGDLIREGATGVAGHVAEPYLAATIRPQVLFPAYVSGFNLVESFYLAMPYVSWQSVIVGDPLCAPFRRDSLSSDFSAPGLDPETQTPSFYSARRLALTTANGTSLQVAKLVIKGDGRLGAGDAAGGREALEAAIKLDPKLTGAQLTLATMYEQAAEYDKAIDRYRSVLAFSPNEVISLNNLAYALAVRKSVPAEALPFAQKAYQLSGGIPTVGDTLGWIQHLVKDDVAAEKLLSAAIKGMPGNATFHMHLAFVYEATGRRPLAQEELSRALQLDPSLENESDVKELRASFAK